jgi:hypothetical protein
MKAFGQAGARIFISPMAIATENMKQYGVELIGSTDDVASIFTPFRPNRNFPSSDGSYYRKCSRMVTITTYFHD